MNPSLSIQAFEDRILSQQNEKFCQIVGLLSKEKDEDISKNTQVTIIAFIYSVYRKKRNTFDLEYRKDGLTKLIVLLVCY